MAWPIGVGGPVRGGQDGVGQRSTGRQAELLRDDVEAGHQLRDAVLDLEPGVDLEEPGRAVRPAEELGGGRVLETGGGRDPDRAVVQIAPLVGRQAGRRRLLDQLLVAALERAVPLPDRDDAARCVAQQLDLDVAGRPDDALQVDRAVAERGQRLGRSGGQRGGQVRRGRDPSHAAAATAGRGLDQDREADPLGLGDDPVHRVGSVDGRGLEGSRDRVDPDGPRDAPGMELVAERVDHRRRRTDEDEPGILDGPREGGPLGQEAVARVDRLGPGRQCRLDDRVDPQVALGGRRGPEAHGRVGQPDVPRVGVGIAVDGDRGHPELVAGADDPDRDLAPVGDQDPLERRPLAAHPAAPSLRKDGRADPRSERDVAMLLPRVRVALVGQHRQRADESRPRLGRPDDVVDIAARRGDVRVGEVRP